jgi:hypothetical protein
MRNKMDEKAERQAEVESAFEKALKGFLGENF